ncbi:MAG: hypothetical protein SH850_31015 [Planctomycetaceae bacterium]|nr:hypothetical protein [Planctomycetaceae bacterium]
MKQLTPDKLTGRERLGLLIEAVLRPSLVESVVREVGQRIELRKAFDPAMQGVPTQATREAVADCLTDDLLDWYQATVRRYGLDPLEMEFVQNAILANAGRSDV